MGWEHPAPGEAWPELEEGVFFVLPSQDTIYKQHRHPHIKIRAQGWGLSGSGLMTPLNFCQSPDYYLQQVLLHSLEPDPIFGFSGLISNLSLVCFFYFPSPPQPSPKLV